MKIRAYWYVAPTIQEIDIPKDVTPDELDEFIRDNLEIPAPDIEFWDEVKS
jgi:hypothetical protein